MPGRSFNSTEYRYSFNGKEKDPEITGTNSHINFGDRIYDSRTGRWLSPDKYAKLYVPISPYAYSLNNPIYFIDADGNIVYGTDGKPVTIEQNSSGNWVIKGKPDKATNKLFKAMLKTPKGVEAVQGYTDLKADEFRFAETTANDLGGAHGQISPVDKEGKSLTSEYDEGFAAFLVQFTTEDTKEDDRMTGWSDEEKMNVIGTHEKTHEKRGVLVNFDEIETVFDELTTRFQYSVMYPEKSADQGKWLDNYVDFFGGTKKVGKAYKKAVGGLIDAGKITKDKGSDMINDFNKTLKEYE